MSAILLTQFGIDHGLNAEDCLRSTSLTIADLRAPGMQITPRQELVIVENLIRRLGTRHGLGVEAGCRLRLPSLGF